MTPARAWPYGSDHPPRAYLQQLARTRRFLDRYRAIALPKPGQSHADYDTIDDYLWAFFQNCWHIKDWLRNDPTVPSTQKQAALMAAEAQPDLRVVADLANGTKHFLEEGDRTGARDAAMQLVDGPDGSTGFMPVIKLSDGSSILALDAAVRGMAAWRAVLSSNDLDYFAGPD
jgi:hypothetical protein